MRRLAVLLIASLGTSLLTASVSADPPPGVDAAIRRGVAHLKKSIPAHPKTGESILAALALVKVGEDVNGPEIQAVIAGIQERCTDTDYKPGTHHYYAAGLELMLLEGADPERYRGEMEKVLAYVLKGQLDTGAWFYPNQTGTGDTSITQYASLGLWAAERAGLAVPKEAWDKMALWHIRTQVRDGGFAYHPGEAGQTHGALPAITVGGAANVLLAKLHLHGERDGAKRSPPKATARESETGKVFGVLETVRLDASANDPRNSAPDRSYSVKASADALQKSADAAVAWTATNFRLPPGTVWRMYYLYGLERVGALGNFTNLGPYDWYAEGAAWLLKEQQPNGGWSDNSGDVTGTAFAIMFLAKSSAKMLGRSYDVAELGGGLLAGGRGLPDDLGKVNVAGGNVEQRTTSGPLDELLARLETVPGADVPDVQHAVLEAIRFGDREKLIGQRDRLRRLANDPRIEVRRTAYWALGRGGELVDVPLLIQGLSDTDPDVAIEAHNALCVLSRRPLAFGLSGNPLGELPEGATAAEQTQAMNPWRQKAITEWTKWYERVAPYEERDGLGLFR